MMRAVYLNPIGGIGGAEVVLLQILASLKMKRPEWELYLVAGSEGPLISQARKLGVKAEVLAFPQSVARFGEFSKEGKGHEKGGSVARLGQVMLISPAVLLYVSKLRSLLRTYKPDLIHTNGLKMNLLGLWARPKGVRVVWHLHDYVGNRPITAALMRRFASGCSTVLINSQSVLEDVRKTCPQVQNLSLFYGSVDVERFSPSGPKLDLDTLAGLPSADANVVRVGLVGTLASWKGHKVFLKALSLLPRGAPVRGYVIGGPIYDTEDSQHSLEELRSVAGELKLGDRVGFTGYIDDAASAFRSLDVVVHASTSPEPFGLVLIEAMACGRPVIASKAGGPTEIIVEGENGFFHTPGDPVSLADRIEELVKNADLRRRLGQSGRKTVVGRFNVTRLGSELVSIYEKIHSSTA